MTIKRIQTGPRMSQAVIHNKTVPARATVVSPHLASGEFKIEIKIEITSDKNAKNPIDLVPPPGAPAPQQAPAPQPAPAPQAPAPQPK